jgi:1-acyl-sn-glycerol-3-phosphate acyltransferase
MLTSVLRPREPLSYGLLRTWARSAVGVYARRLDVSAPRGLPADTPTVFAINHRNALADVAVLIAAVPRFPHFLAAATWWRRRPARVLFRLGGVYPVHRSRDGAGTQNNHSTFEACCEALADGQQLAIFPEGELNMGSEMLALKTGAVRIGLAARDSGVDGVQIVPVGIAYEHPDRFRTAISASFGEPLCLDDLEAPPDAPADRIVRELTGVLQQRLSDAVDEAVERVGDDAGPSRSQVLAELVLLSPAALVGAVVNAPPLLAGIVLQRIAPPGWRITAKAVAGTLLVPATWATLVVLASRRFGRLRGVAFAGTAGVAGGVAVLGWVDRWNRLRSRPTSSG